jgi:hypothetical protein
VVPARLVHGISADAIAALEAAGMEYILGDLDQAARNGKCHDNDHHSI